MTAIASTVSERVDALAWDDLTAQLDDRGFAVTEPLLTADECAELAELFDGGRFRSTIDMARHRFGDGRYRYFEHPLPDTIAALRARVLRAARARRQRVGVADRRRGHASRSRTTALLERCREAGQERPTPLILRYGAGDWNALHQDLYGDVYFPFQILTVLTDVPRGRRVRADGAAPARAEPRARAQPAARARS